MRPNSAGEMSPGVEVSEHSSDRTRRPPSVIDMEGLEVAKTLEVGGKPFGIYVFDPSRGEMAGNR